MIEEFKIHRAVLQGKIKQQASKIAELENVLNIQEYKRKALS